MQNSESARNAEALVASIKSQFPDHFLIEVYVLMKGGNPLQVYSGRQPGLAVGCLREVLARPGTLYLFSIAGIPPKLVDIPDMVKEKGIRLQFCWITPPLPPTVTKRGSNELGLEWQPLVACGVEVDAEEQQEMLQYVLEGAQGEQFHRGVAPTSLAPAPGTDFKVIAKGQQLLSSTVEQLDASYWYYWRVVFEYAGARFESPPVAINTLGSAPLVPRAPLVEVEKSPGPMLEKRTSVEYRVRLSWPPADYVGASIEKYMLQLHEVSVGLTDTEKESMAPGVNSPKSKMFRQYHKIAIDENIERTIQTKDVVSSRWQTVYCDNVNSCTLKAPPLGALQWNFRLRAKNCYGWSEDWVYFFINAKSHPVIFPAGKNFDPRRYTRTAPASKEPAPALQTQPSTASQSHRGSPPSSAPPLSSGSVLEAPQGGRSFARTAGGVDYDLAVIAAAPEKPKPEPADRPPRGLRYGQLAQHSTDTGSVWMDDGRSLDVHSADGSYVNDEDKLQKLTASEVTRVIDRKPEQYSMNKEIAEEAIGTPFISSYEGTDLDSLN